MNSGKYLGSSGTKSYIQYAAFHEREDIITVCYKIITLRGLLGVAAAPLVHP